MYDGLSYERLNVHSVHQTGGQYISQIQLYSHRLMYDVPLRLNDEKWDKWATSIILCF